MPMFRHLLHAWLVSSVVAALGCGPEKPVRKDPNFADLSAHPHHDYSATWVYAVGEVDAPAASDCEKALKFADGEGDCVGAACKYGANLLKDFEFGCRTVATAQQRERATTLKSQLIPRAAQSPTECSHSIDEWLERGCGHDGACEPQIQDWATQCLEEVKSPLALHLLERLVENSLREGHRVKFDVRSCDEYKTRLVEAAKCAKQFDCEDAMPRITEYVERCAKGKRKAIPLAQALAVTKIRLGAEKSLEPLALTEVKAKVSSLPGVLALAAGDGAVIKICGEPVTELTAYLDQRQRCERGEITWLAAVNAAEGPTLELQTSWHESDAAFTRTHSKLLVDGEAEARAGKVIADVVTAIANLPKSSDFAAAFERANLAYAQLSPALRQSEQLYSALAAQDPTLVTMFGLMGEQKVRLFGRRLNDRDLFALWRRTDKLVFADVTKKGGVDIGKSCELSELMLEQALPQSFAAYRQKLGQVKQLAEKRKPTSELDATALRETLMSYTRACSTARAQVSAMQKEAERCATAADACNAEERGQLAQKLDGARADWRSARVEEILAKVSLGQAETPSAVCANW